MRRRLPTITSPANLVNVIARGRSMEPTFGGGSILLVDEGARDIRVDGIYVLAYNDERCFKQVARRLPDGALFACGDDPLHRGGIENGIREVVPVPGRVARTFDSKGV